MRPQFPPANHRRRNASNGKVRGRLEGLLALFAVAFAICPTAMANHLKFKAVYRDPAEATGWSNQAAAQAVADFFEIAVSRLGSQAGKPQRCRQTEDRNHAAGRAGKKATVGIAGGAGVFQGAGSSRQDAARGRVAAALNQLAANLSRSSRDKGREFS